MPLKPQLDSGDQKILIVAGIILVGFVVAGFMFYPPSARFSPGFPSSYSAASDGGKAAYLLLSGLGYRVKRWARPPDELPEPGKNKDVVLILAHPLAPPSAEDRAAIRSFVAQGGQVLATNAVGALLVGGKASYAKERGNTWQEFSAEVPASLTRRAPVIRMGGRLRWSRLEPRQQRYYGDQHGASVVGYEIGRGRIVWWASASPLTNYGIAQASNLALFLNSIGITPQKSLTAPSATHYAARPGSPLILWDEYFHGQEKSLWAYVAVTPVPWALLQFTLLGAAALIAYGRRLGPLRSLVSAGMRSSPLEFVDALGGLYQRKGDAAGALQIAYQQFRSRLLRTLGLPLKTVTNEDIVNAVCRRLGGVDLGLREALYECERGLHAANLSEAQALRLVQELHDYARHFGLNAAGL